MLDHTGSVSAAHVEAGPAAADPRDGIGDAQTCSEPNDGRGRERDRQAAGASRGSDVLAARWPRLCHDLRTPLNAVLGNAELLLDGSAGPLSGQARACLADIQAAGLRMMRQVEVLLELCRLRATPAREPAGALDLIELLRNAQEAAPLPAATIQVIPEGARLVVQGDGVWLRALAGALIELRHGDSQLGGPLLATVEPQTDHAAGVVLRVFWGEFRPDRAAALPLALIDAILDLHEGMATLSGDGLRLYWPAWRLIPRRSPSLVPAGERKSE